MRVTISKSKSAEQLYITKAYRNENGKSTSRIVAKLGSMETLLPQHDFNREKVLAWAKQQAQIYTAAEKKEELKLSLELSENKQLSLGEVNLFGGGYLFLQTIFYQLGMKDICTQISQKYHFEYDLAEILCGLVLARILAPSSKLSSFDYLGTLLEQPKFKLHDLYRALDVLDQDADAFQAMLYQHNRKERNTAVLYYDCTNFFFEIEEEKGIRRYGKSKEHRPNPIVQMGLFLDGDGIPLAFTIFSGNESEQPTLIPLEKKILKDYDLSKAICEAIYEYDKDLIVMGLSGSEMIKAAADCGLRAASEVFADRAYEEDGTLVNRRKAGAMIEDENEAIKRVVRMVKEGKVTSITGKDIDIKADSICVHGDGEKALLFVEKIRKVLAEEKIEIRHL